jgi:hypothetical protein
MQIRIVCNFFGNWGWKFVQHATSLCTESNTSNPYLLTYSVPLVSKRTISTERPPVIGEVSANFCWYRVPRGQCDRSLRPYCRISRPYNRHYFLVVCIPYALIARDCKVNSHAVLHTQSIFSQIQQLQWKFSYIPTWSESASELYGPSDRRLSAKRIEGATWSTWRILRPYSLFSRPMKIYYFMYYITTPLTMKYWDTLNK